MRERWVNDVFIIEPSGDIHRVAISLDDVMAQATTLRESVGEPPDPIELDDGTLWVDRRAVERHLAPNGLASLLAGSNVLGTAVFTGRDSSGGIANLGDSAVRRLWACSKRLQLGEGSTG